MNWDEVKTAFQVARVGTVSGAAEVLGVHHATVIRHIDALEAELKTKLFQRHARGYTPTEAGQDLLQVAKVTDDQFTQMVGRLKGQGAEISGDLVVTSLRPVGELLAPILVDFQRMHPGLRVRFLTGARVFRLEYGEAHVAIRAGKPPQEPDNVVQPFSTVQIGLYADKDYVERNGMPKTDEELAKHDFVGPDDESSRAPFFQWMKETIPQDRVLFRCSDQEDGERAIIAGAGIGFMSEVMARSHPNLVEIAAPRKEWEAASWIVTHVDLHRTPKVQAFLKFLKERARAQGYG
ncbi:MULTISPECIES: LysR family transcriptional regulator [Halocynthiibacter]|uniref:LysR family transcriptional regulator n=1 Tax=Halocynthiibacter halioticoli TaxID=2986804 RepID=A0AAE3LTN8_9RHOB|nr:MULTISPECIES: LysR family transcriptional regulator [Halocynthiibacter]MCV6825446.1 LysR family transcriptional regulator [Halocynthiibacter halioticoli]MCW4058447.1 LysR family transcriptional regulator [Halocynthiibacter sp. SDUM655004]